MNVPLLSGLPGLFNAAGNGFLRLGETGQSESEASRIRAVPIATVMRNTPWTVAANIGNALLTLSVFRQSPHVWWIAAWAALICLSALVAGYGWWSGYRGRQRETASLRGTRAAVIYAAVLGTLWALLAASFYPIATEDQRIVLVALTVGMTGGSGFALATLPPAVIAFTGSLGSGALVALYARPDAVSLSLATLYVIYVAIIVRASLALCESFTARVRAQISADEQRDVIGLLLNDFEENASDWLWGVDSDLRMLRVSPRFFELTGLDDATLLGKPIWQALPFWEGASQAMRQGDGADGLRQALERREPFRELELAVMQHGQPAIWSISAKPIFDSSNRFHGFRGVGRDVTAQREARRRIEYMVRHDALTDLGNRLLMNDGLSSAIERLDKRGDPFALLLLDLDRFKQVNDIHGHGAGDELLKLVAKALKALVGSGDTLARLGGDEFVIVQAAAVEPHRAAELAEQIKAALIRPFQLTTGTVRIGVSIGIAYAPTDGRDTETLMRHADLALYRAKADGRNRYRFFESSLDAAARRRNLIEQELREAVASNALSLNYQPLMEPGSGMVACVEVLLRWNHPTLGNVSPVEFVPIAEDIGLIGQIGGWVIREGCRTALSWPERVKVAINLSPLQFSNLGLFQTVRSTLAETGLPPARLEFEVTESLLLNSNNVVEATLVAIRNLGVGIALDDFGTGYSSLSYLRNYRFDKLKIDRSFISDIENNDSSRAIVEAIVKMARHLDIRLTAEGVETREQYDLLVEMGCDHLQGYFIARPMGESAMLAFLDKGAFTPASEVRQA